MFNKDKVLRGLLFGKETVLKDINDDRKVMFDFPSVDDDLPDIRITYASSDGVILYLIKRIEKLEKKLDDKIWDFSRKLDNLKYLEERLDNLESKNKK
jgi:hypothetical protein